MSASDVIVWGFLLLSIVPIFIVRRQNRTIKTQLFLVRYEIGLAVSAPFVGMHSEAMGWFYYIIAALWAFNAWTSILRLRSMEEAEEIEALHKKLMEGNDR